LEVALQQPPGEQPSEDSNHPGAAAASQQEASLCWCSAFVSQSLRIALLGRALLAWRRVTDKACQSKALSRLGSLLFLEQDTFTAQLCLRCWALLLLKHPEVAAEGTAAAGKMDMHHSLSLGSVDGCSDFSCELDWPPQSARSAPGDLLAPGLGEAKPGHKAMSVRSSMSSHDGDKESQPWRASLSRSASAPQVSSGRPSLAEGRDGAKPRFCRPLSDLVFSEDKPLSARGPRSPLSHLGGRSGATTPESPALLRQMTPSGRLTTFIMMEVGQRNTMLMKDVIEAWRSSLMSRPRGAAALVHHWNRLSRSTSR